MLFIHEKLLVYKLETFKNCKEVKHIGIMIIAIIYIFLSYVIFDQQLKMTIRKSSGPPEKIYSPFFFTPSLKVHKFQVAPFLPTFKKSFAPPPAERGEDVESEIFSDSVGLWMQPRIIYFLIQN